MATSGSYDYSVTAAQIIQAALEDLQVIENGESVDANDQTLALQRLNFIAKQWSGRTDMKPGLKIWSRQRVTLFLASGQQSYLIGPGSTDARATTRLGRTTIDAAEASGQTVLSVAATTDTTTQPGTTVTMTAADLIGIEQDNGTIHWSTISSLVAGDTVTIAAGLSAAAAVGNYVYWFTARAQRFEDFDAVVLRDEDRTDTPLMVYREVADYDAHNTDKYATGDPTAVLVEPLLTQTRITFDSQPSDVTRQVIFTVYYPAEDYDSSADTIAFPQAYFAALEWELAFRLAPAFGKPWSNEMNTNHQAAVAVAGQVTLDNSTAYFQPGKN